MAVHVYRGHLLCDKLDSSSFPNKYWFLRVRSVSLLKYYKGKGEIARNKQFLLFPQCFLP